MSQGGNEIEKAPDQGLTDLTSTIEIKIRKDAQKTNSLFSSACNIYRVPEELRNVKESAYTPRLIAIGPLHQNDKHLKTPFQGIKMSYTNNLLCRLTTVKMERLEKKYEYSTVLQDCVKEMNDCVDKAKQCYAEELNLSNDDMLEMMLVDGCFILELLYRFFDESKSIPKEAKNIPKEEGQEGKRNGASTSSDLLTPLLQASNEVNTEASNEVNMETRRGHDPIFDNNLIRYTVESDLISLENQIPLFVLEKLFQLTVGRIPNSLHKDWSLTDYVFKYFCNIMTLYDEFWSLLLRGPAHEESVPDSSSAKTWCPPSDCVLRIFGNKVESSTTAAAEEKNVQRGNYYHILHILHDGFLPEKRPTLSSKKKKIATYTTAELGVMSSASELTYAGVKFVPGKTNDDAFRVKFTEPEGLFRWFRSAQFEIPQIFLYDHTESLLRNLIAFEQCCPGVSRHVSSYAYLMDMLVNSDSDVQVLEKARVVSNYLGDRKGATDLFNKLGILVFSGDHYDDTIAEATLYSRRFWPKHLARLRRRYFDSPWTFIAFCVAFIAFVMTFLQFIRDFI